MKPGHRYLSSSCRFSNISSDEYAKSTFSSSSHSSFLTTSGRTLGVFLAVNQFFLATCAKWFSPCRSATVGRACRFDDSVACALVAPFRALDVPSCLIPSMVMYPGPNIVSLSLGDAADGVRAHCCRGFVSRKTRQEKSCRSNHRRAEGALLRTDTCPLGRQLHSYQALRLRYSSSRQHNVEQSRPCCEAPGRCARQGPHWRLSCKQLLRRGARNGSI